MNGRSRVLAALEHREPDRPPRDLGGSVVTGIHPSAYCALKRHLGLDTTWRYVAARAQLAYVEEPVRERLGVDLLPIVPESMCQPLDINREGANVDRWGVERRLPAEGGHYYVSRSPLATAERQSELSAYAWPEPQLDFAALGEAARRLRQESDKALVLNTEVGFLHQAQFLRAFDLWLMDLVASPEFAASLMDRVLEIWLAETRAVLEAVGGCADVVLYSDDIAFQNAPMVSLDTYRRLIRPRQRKVFDLLRSSGMKVMYHTCGNVWTLLGELVDLGVDALNPLQVSARDMGDTSRIKKLWGDDLSFWGGIDTQHTLPVGTPAEVQAEVHRRLDDLAVGGGYVVAAVHDIQAEVPPENVCAMFDAVDEWRH